MSQEVLDRTKASCSGKPHASLISPENQRKLLLSRESVSFISKGGDTNPFSLRYPSLQSNPVRAHLTRALQNACIRNCLSQAHQSSARFVTKSSAHYCTAHASYTNLSEALSMKEKRKGNRVNSWIENW